MPTVPAERAASCYALPALPCRVMLCSLPARVPARPLTPLRPYSDHDGHCPAQTEEFRDAGYYRSFIRGDGNCAFRVLAAWQEHIAQQYHEMGWDAGPLRSLPGDHMAWRQCVVHWMWDYQDLLGPTAHCNPEWMHGMHGWEYTRRQTQTARRQQVDEHAPSVQDALFHPTKGLINADVWAPVIVFKVAATILQKFGVALPTGETSAFRVFVGTQGQGDSAAAQNVRECKPMLLPQIAGIFRKHRLHNLQRNVQPTGPPDASLQTLYNVDSLLHELNNSQDAAVRNLVLLFRATFPRLHISRLASKKKNTIPHHLLHMAMTREGPGLQNGAAMPWDLVVTNYPEALHWELCLLHAPSVRKTCLTLADLWTTAVELLVCDPRGVQALLLNDAPILGGTTKHVHTNVRRSTRLDSTISVTMMDGVLWDFATFCKCLREQTTPAVFHMPACENLEMLALDSVHQDDELFQKYCRERKTGHFYKVGQVQTSLRDLLATRPAKTDSVEMRVEYRLDDIPLCDLESQLWKFLRTLRQRAPEFRALLASIQNALKSLPVTNDMHVDLQFIATAPTSDDPGFVDSHWDSQMAIMVMLIGRKVWQILPAAHEYVSLCTIGPDSNENADLTPASRDDLPWQQVTITPGDRPGLDSM